MQYLTAARCRSCLNWRSLLAKLTPEVRTNSSTLVHVANLRIAKGAIITAIEKAKHHTKFDAEIIAMRQCLPLSIVEVSTFTN